MVSENVRFYPFAVTVIGDLSDGDAVLLHFDEAVSPQGASEQVVPEQAREASHVLHFYLGFPVAGFM